MRKAIVNAAAAVIVAAVLFLANAPASAGTATMPVSEVKPGMIGTMLTVMSGAEPGKFELKIIGVNRKSNAGGDMIIARLMGDELEHTGVAAGMSGSPVYIDGKLVGAVAWAWSFSKDPICGITPIGDMLTTLDSKGGGSGGGDTAPSGGLNFRSVLGEISGTNPPAREPFVAEKKTVSAYAPGFGEVSFEPVATPVTASGFTAGARGALLRYFERSTGMGAVSGVITGGSASDIPGADALAPGGVLAIPLIVGDFEAAALGTVTWRDGPDVLGFGHPMFNEGNVNMPLAGGVITHVLANQTVSFKMGDPSNIVGSITVDGQYAVRGAVGAAPDMVPVKIKVTDNSRGTSGAFEVKVLRHDEMTLGLMSSAVMNAVGVVAGDSGEATVRVRVKARFSGGAGDFDISDVYYLPAAGYIDPADRLYDIISNPYVRVRMESAEIEAVVDKKQQTAQITAVRIKDNAIRAGEPLEAVIELMRYDGSTEKVPVSFDIPRDATPGLYKFIALAAGGLYLRDTPPDNFNQYMQDVRERLSNDTIAAVVVYPEKSPALKGETLRDMPATMRDLITTGGYSGVTPVDKLDKVLLKRDGAIAGQAISMFTVEKAK